MNFWEFSILSGLGKSSDIFLLIFFIVITSVMVMVFSIILSGEISEFCGLVSFFWKVFILVLIEVFSQSCLNVMFLDCLYELVFHCFFNLFIIFSKFWIWFLKLLYKSWVRLQILIENLIVHSQSICSYFLLPLGESGLSVLAFTFLPTFVSVNIAVLSMLWSLETSTVDASERTKSI